MIPYSKQSIFLDDLWNTGRTLFSKNLTQGPDVIAFENKIAAKVGARFAVAVSSATAGLDLAVQVAKEATGAKSVLTSAVSFVASANCALYNNLDLHFIDIDSQTGLLSMDELATKIKSLGSTPSITIPVHYAGMTAPIAEIRSLAPSNVIIEDAAHALGSKFPDGTPVGSCDKSDMTVFSFHPVKSITTGEGGVITTNNKHFYERLCSLRTHGIIRISEQNETLYSHTQGEPNPWFYEMSSLGRHYRMTDLQASLGSSQLKKLDIFVQKRQELALMYQELFQTSELITPCHTFTNLSAFHLFPIQIDYTKIAISKANLMMQLRQKGIGTQVHYIPIPLHPYYKSLGFQIDDYPQALEFYHKTFSIPIFPRLSLRKARWIARTLESLLASNTF